MRSLLMMLDRSCCWPTPYQTSKKNNTSPSSATWTPGRLNKRQEHWMMGKEMILEIEEWHLDVSCSDGRKHARYSWWQPRVDSRDVWYCWWFKRRPCQIFFYHDLELEDNITTQLNDKDVETVNSAGSYKNGCEMMWMCTRRILLVSLSTEVSWKHK